MSQLTTSKVRIVGMSACVPSTIEENLKLPIFADENEAAKVIASTGIERHRKAAEGCTASDLSIKAIEKLIAE